MLVEQGFKVVDKTTYKEHSCLYTCERVPEPLAVMAYENKYTEYKGLFMDFVQYHENMIGELNKQMQQTTEPVYLFGAHIFSEFLFAFGLDRGSII